jgi:hypothetical protein
VRGRRGWSEPCLSGAWSGLCEEGGALSKLCFSRAGSGLCREGGVGPSPV